MAKKKTIRTIPQERTPMPEQAESNTTNAMGARRTSPFAAMSDPQN